MKILAIDLGKFNCVSCLFDTETNTTELATIKTDRIKFEGLLNRMRPQRVVMATCSIIGWVNDLCVEQGYEVLVAAVSRSVALEKRQA